MQNYTNEGGEEAEEVAPIPRPKPDFDFDVALRRRKEGARKRRGVRG